MSSCRKLKQNRVKIIQMDDQEQNVRKYLYVKIQNKKVKMQLDSGSDIFIINTQTWKNIGKPTLFKSNKIARTVTGRKINFVGEVWLNINFSNRSENEVENTLNNTISELPVSLKEIKREAVRDNFIKEIKAKLLEKNTKIEETYSLCDNVLLYSELYSRNTKNSSKKNSS